MGFLDKYRGALPADVKLYAGGEDNLGPESPLYRLVTPCLCVL